MTRIIEILASEDSDHAAGGFPEALLPGPGDYVGYYRNDDGEEILFIQRKGEETGRVIHSDADWEPYEVVRGRCYELNLSEEEEGWLAVCWQASAHFRPDQSRELGPTLSFEESIGLHMAGKSVTELAKTGELATLLDRVRNMQEATCKWCHQPIALLPGGAWLHHGKTLARRGCRAASFERLGTWDDTLDKSWKATPAK